MKKCQKCNFQNEALIDYCWQCGSQLAGVSEVGNYYQSPGPTVGFQTETPTIYRARPTQEFNVNQNNFASGYTPQPPRPANYNKIFLALGSIFVFFLLFSVAGATAAYQIFFAPIKDPSPPRPATVPLKEPELPKTLPAKESELPPTLPAKEEKEELEKTNPVKESKPAKTNSTEKNSKRKTSTSPSTKFERIWVDYNVTESGRLGMRIHVKFEVYDMKDVDSYLAVYFEKSDGTKLRSKSKKFSSENGQVAVFRLLKPAYEETVYKDLELFMPYDEFKLGRGKYNLKMDVDVIYENGDLIEHLSYHDFQYEKF